MRPAYYNEWDKYCAQWLRNLMAAGHIPAGEVDERDIKQKDQGPMARSSSDQVERGMLGREPRPYQAISSSALHGAVHCVQIQACGPNPRRDFRCKIHKTLVHPDFDGGIASGLNQARAWPWYVCGKGLPALGYVHGICERSVLGVSAGTYRNKCAFDLHPWLHKKFCHIRGKYAVYRYLSEIASSGRRHRIFENRTGYLGGGIHKRFHNFRTSAFSSCDNAIYYGQGQ